VSCAPGAKSVIHDCFVVVMIAVVVVIINDLPTNRRRPGNCSSWNCQRTVDDDVKHVNLMVVLKFHGSSVPRSILVTSSRGRPQQVVRVVLAWQAERGSRCTPDTPTSSRRSSGVSGVSARMSRGCYEETDPVEFKL